jgi:S1-C subfamily serine protease
VIDGASSAKITTSDGKTYDVSGVYDFSESNDLALLQVNGSNFPYLELGDSSAVVAGQKIYAIGSPRGLDNTISDGMVSNTSRLINGVSYIQISAAISHGSSGGALLNTYGQVIGVTTAGLDDAQNLNFAVPVNLLQGLTKTTLIPLSAVSKPALTLTANPSSVTVAKGAKVTVTLTASSDEFDMIAPAKGNESLLSFSWGDWSGKSIQLTITGLAVGSGTQTIGLLDEDGNALATTDISFTVTNATTALSVTVSPSSVTVAKGAKATVTIAASSGDFDAYIFMKGNESLISCDWGSESGNSIQLILTGVAAGSGTLWVGLVDAEDNLLAKASVSFTVTAGGGGGTSVAYYPGYFPVPDFGALNNVRLFDSKTISSGKCFWYSVNDMQDSVQAFLYYDKALTDNGFVYMGNVTGYDDLFWYYNSTYDLVVDVGVSYHNGVDCIGIVIGR